MMTNVTVCGGFFMPGFWESINARVSLEGKPFEAPWAFFIPRIELGKVARTVGRRNAIFS
jgi:hypothetical protein